MSIGDRIYSTLADILGLSLFSSLREHPLLMALRELLDDLSEGKDEGPMYGILDTYLDIVEDWAAFTNAFIQTQRDYSFYVTLGCMVISDENPYTYAAETQETVPAVLSAMAKTDLSRLGRIAALEIHNLGFHLAELLRKSGLDQIASNIEEESRVLWAAEGKKGLGENSSLVLRIFPENSNWGASLPALTEYLRINGAGILGQHSSFSWALDSIDEEATGSLSLALCPVQNPDPITLAGLFGYEEQRSTVIANTRRLLAGKSANNLLLYGDRGTGKSATVKAVCNEYAEWGLKLISIGKSGLSQLSGIMDMLAGRSRFFIIFIDDLSFESVDDSFRNLKALLEGGVETRPPNVVVYATSNRRHMVKERLADRPTSAQAAESLSTGDVRAFDTMQEQFSLADRFGVTVVFSSPSQDEYLRIAECIACRRGLLPEPLADGKIREKFRENALRWEKWFNGRSPRTAVQYVDWIAGESGEGAASGQGTATGQGAASGQGAACGLRFPWD
jgi:predicted AAA+ superfamily ATPase